MSIMCSLPFFSFGALSSLKSLFLSLMGTLSLARFRTSVFVSWSIWKVPMHFQTPFILSVVLNHLILHRGLCCCLCCQEFQCTASCWQRPCCGWAASCSRMQHAQNVAVAMKRNVAIKFVFHEGGCCSPKLPLGWCCILVQMWVKRSKLNWKELLPTYWSVSHHR